MTPRQKTERVTIKTVAADAGVSVAAVSKVLRDAYGVSATLRGKVQASIEKLGYRLQAAARGMRGRTLCEYVCLHVEALVRDGAEDADIGAAVDQQA